MGKFLKRVFGLGRSQEEKFAEEFMRVEFKKDYESLRRAGLLRSQIISRNLLSCSYN